MKFQPLRRMKFWFPLIVLIIPFKIYGNQLDSSFKEINETKSGFADFKANYAQSALRQLRHRWFCLIDFKAGHHDNFTEVKYSNDSAFQQSAVWSFASEIGLAYDKNYLALFGAVVSPWSQGDKNGYIYETSLFYGGLVLKRQLINRGQKFNFVPQIGYKWLKEKASIKDSGGGPALLDDNFVKNGIIIGLGLHIRGYIDSTDMGSIVLEYVREQIGKGVNRYKLSYLGELFDFQADFEHNKYLSRVVKLIYSIEYLDWGDGRNDWYISLALGIEAKL